MPDECEAVSTPGLDMTSRSNNLEDKHHEWNQDVISQLEAELMSIEKILNSEWQTLEEWTLTHEEEKVLRVEPCSSMPNFLCIANRIKSALQWRSKAKERIPKEQYELQEQLKVQQALYKEVEMERDVLLQQVHTYLQTNSSLRVRLEEQRCQTGALQRQLNADLEERVKDLENDNKQLSKENSELGNKLYKMLRLAEERARNLMKKETEVLTLKNHENNLISSLKGELQIAQEEKAKAEEKYANLKEQIDDYFSGKSFEGLSFKKNLFLRKSLSPCKQSSGFLLSAKDVHKVYFLPRPRASFNMSSVHSANYCSKKEEKPEHSEPSVHTQLNALKRGLLNVTRKLEILKCQLTSSGAVEEKARPLDNPSRLKRKANCAEEIDCGISEDSKSGFRNLKSILEDAKNLNVKLQNMREEKQKIIELNKKETGVQVDTKKNDKLCQTGEHPEMPFREFQNALTKMKKALKDCEEKVDGQKMNADEAFVCFVSALTACVLCNFKCSHEWRGRTGLWFGNEIDTNSLMDEGSNGSREVTSPGENGGGDNLLKKRISTDGLGCAELKIQIDRLRYKIEQRFKRKEFG